MCDDASGHGVDPWFRSLTPEAISSITSGLVLLDLLAAMFAHCSQHSLVPPSALWFWSNFGSAYDAPVQPPAAYGLVREPTRSTLSFCRLNSLSRRQRQL